VRLVIRAKIAAFRLNYPFHMQSFLLLRTYVCKTLQNSRLERSLPRRDITKVIRGFSHRAERLLAIYVGEAPLLIVQEPK